MEILTAGTTGPLAGTMAETTPWEEVIQATRYDDTAKHQYEITVDTATASTKYVLEVDDHLVEYTSGADSVTKASVATGIKTALSQHMWLGRRLKATSEAEVVSIEATSVGQVLEVGVLEGALSVTKNQRPAHTEGIPPGSLVLWRKDNQTDVVPAKAKFLSKKKIVLTPTAANNTVFIVMATVNGVPYIGRITSDGNATAQEIATALAAKLEGLFPANTVKATADSAVLTLESEIAGLDFTAGTTDGLVIADSSVQHEHTDINNVVAGITQRVYRDPGGRDTNMSVFKRGYVYVRYVGTRPKRGGAVYVVLSGANQGLFSTQPTTSSVLVKGCRFRHTAKNVSRIAVLSCEF